MKLFTDRRFLPPGVNHSILLKPFWGDDCNHNGFAKFCQWANVEWQLVAADEADVAVLPFDGRELLRAENRRNRTELQRLAQEFVDLAQTHGLTTVVVVNNDSSRKLGLKGNVLVLRTSLDRRERNCNEFALMATHEDIVATHLSGELPFRTYVSVPTVSFCGHVAADGPSSRRKLKRLLALASQQFGVYWPDNDGIWTRRDAIRLLKSANNLETSFIQRAEYFGGVVKDVPERVSARRDYIDNILMSDYVLCVRGYGNFSFRFFEAMSLGRTPLLVDTECVLPFDFLHDYSDLIVVVPISKLSRIADYVWQFHVQFSKGGYTTHQNRLRHFWEEWLSPQGYFSKLPTLLKAARTEGGTPIRSVKTR